MGKEDRCYRHMTAEQRMLKTEAGDWIPFLGVAVRCSCRECVKQRRALMERAGKRNDEPETSSRVCKREGAS